MHPMTQKKEKLKEMAKEIRELKSSRKGGKSIEVLSDISYKIWRLKREYRHEHIAYCLVRGRSYGQIECPRENNRPDFKLIDKLQIKLQTAMNKANEEWLINHPPKEVQNG
jgi:hypothetical protein